MMNELNLYPRLARPPLATEPSTNYRVEATTLNRNTAKPRNRHERRALEALERRRR